MALTISGGVSAGTVIDAGTFTNAGDVYTVSPYSGIFTDVVKFDLASSGLKIRVDGKSEGMAADDLLLTNTADGTDYHLSGKSFVEYLDLGPGSYVFTLSGFAMNAFDSNINSDYEITLSAVPLPAAAWLFGSALIGFISFSRRRKI
jgi:hypothetical protein